MPKSLSLTIENHTETPDGYVLTVRVADTTPECFAGVAVDATADGDDVLATTRWPADTPPEDQRRETRRLIEHALTTAAAAPTDPVEVTAPGTEL